MAGILGRLTGRKKQLPTVLAAAPAQRTIKPAEYGMPLRADLRTDLCVTLPGLDAAIAAAKDGRWEPVAALFAEVGDDWELRYLCTTALAEQAVEDDGWLAAWRHARPGDVAAECVHAYALVNVAWKIRSSDRAEKVGQEQWDGFFRVLREVPAVCAAAADLAPADPTPWIVLLTAARGLQWSHEEFNAVWAEVKQRAPLHFRAHSAAMSYWRPRWYGSEELMVRFVEEAVAAAPTGSLLSMLRLDMLNSEFRPKDPAELKAFWTSDRVTAAVDAALADLAAAEPAHLRIGAMRSWLAFFLTRGERWAEAVEQFRLIGTHIAAEPWSYSKDRTTLFTTTRANAVLGWEDAGRPELP
jgi:hypothetical protein